MRSFKGALDDAIDKLAKWKEGIGTVYVTDEPYRGAMDYAQNEFDKRYPPTPMFPPRLSIEERLELLVARGVTIEFDETLGYWVDHVVKPKTKEEAYTFVISTYDSDETIKENIVHKNHHLDMVDKAKKSKEKFNKLKERFDPQQKEASPTEPPTTPK